MTYKNYNYGIYLDDFQFEVDAQPIQKNYSEEEDSYVRILNDSIVHLPIDRLDERDQLDKELLSLD